MGLDPRAAIARLLDDHKPRSLLLLSPDRDGSWRSWCERQGAAVTAIQRNPLDALEALGRYDLALIIGFMEQLDKAEGMQLIGRLRNVHTEHLFVLVGPDARWRATDWYALALRRLDRFEDGDHLLSLYGYDLESYNRVRSWNNPKYWAHPENWGRYWW